MTQINWDLLGQPVDIGGAIQQGLQQGQQRNRERATDNALRALIANPNDPNVVNELAKYDPRMAYQIQGQQVQQQRAQAEQAARVGAARGDQGALEDLAGFNLDDWFKFDKRTKDEYAKGIETIGQLALMADTPQEWDDIVGQLAQHSPELQRYIGRFDLREAIIAEAGKASEFIKQNQPSYQVIPEGGMLVNTRDPQALAQVGGGQGGPQPGTVEDGYRFKGGNPADPNSWEPADGAAPPISAAPSRPNTVSRSAYQAWVGQYGREGADEMMRRNGLTVGNY